LRLLRASTRPGIHRHNSPRHRSSDRKCVAMPDDIMNAKKPNATLEETDRGSDRTGIPVRRFGDVGHAPKEALSACRAEHRVSKCEQIIHPSHQLEILFDRLPE